MINSNDALSDDFFLNEESYTRDRIVILGRRSSGKTVYLSALYSRLWNSSGLLRLKALKGASHVEFIRVAEDLKANKWPPATQGISENILELSYNEQKKMIVALDYPGEVFTNAFVKVFESKETTILLDHIDHAQALIVLVDPEHIAEGDFYSKVDNDFGILQAINRIQNWPDGKDIPIVLVLTKADKSYPLIKKHGGTKEFIVKHLSTLIRDIHGIKGCCLSAFTSLSGSKTSFIAVEEPLLYCLKKIQTREDKLLEQRKKARYHQYITKMDTEQKAKDSRNTLLVTIAFTVVFLLLLYLTNRILPSTVWHNLWQNTLGRFF